MYWLLTVYYAHRKYYSIQRKQFFKLLYTIKQTVALPATVRLFWFHSCARARLVESRTRRLFFLVLFCRRKHSHGARRESSPNAGPHTTGNYRAQVLYCSPLSSFARNVNAFARSQVASLRWFPTFVGRAKRTYLRARVSSYQTRHFFSGSQR